MDNIRIIIEPISTADIKKVADERFGDMVKVVVDVEKQIMAIGGELHADEEAKLLEQNSKQKDLWGINIYPDIPYPDCIEFDSMINIRPGQNNRTRGVDDEEICTKIFNIIQKLIAEYRSI